MRITALTVAVGSVGILSGSALAGFIGTPQNRDRSQTRIYSGSAVHGTYVGGPLSLGPGLGDVYSNMNAGPSGFQAFALASGYVGFDDYDSTKDANILLGEFAFIGGVSTAGGIAFFSFFDASSNLVDSFGVALPSAGDFIWTITLNTPFSVPDGGVVSMFVDSATTGRWFLSDAGPDIGTEDPLFGGTGDGTLSHLFRLNDVPAPGALALMGVAGLLGSRRRRRS